MAIEIVAIQPSHFAAIHRFAARTWQRPRTRAFLRWRYAGCPTLFGYLALRDGECAAMITGFRRPVRLGKETVEFHEAFDWYCLPELRRSGLGVRVMQRLMQDPEPVTVVGGTPDTRELLPRLKFGVPAAVRSYSLALGTERAAAKLERRLHLPRSIGRVAYRKLVRGFRLPPRFAAPTGARVIPVAIAGDEVGELYDRIDRGTVPAWTLDQLRWLGAGFPGVGQWLTLYFARSDELLGLALVRIHSSEGGCSAQLVEVFAPQPDPDLYGWMISEAVHRAAAWDPELITAGTSCPVAQGALTRCRFRAGEELPIHYWHRDGRPLETPIRFVLNWGDAPLLPYPERWWGAPAAPETA